MRRTITSPYIVPGQGHDPELIGSSSISFGSNYVFEAVVLQIPHIDEVKIFGKWGLVSPGVASKGVFHNNPHHANTSTLSFGTFRMYLL
ncbi:hypothetical protein TNIN_493461 [Trichonephila inaurata madagascariensis]|uniref:Uncharacterized protein n=1 Tax=Trichonephila inaurata madagascariensis TaxID=2747483 RepID=A0A8X7C4H5_9ARAC|nr:hypothetical protein TNIN_493461 [Trichonephila inaurata madagascariensis]